MGLFVGRQTLLQLQAPSSSGPAAPHGLSNLQGYIEELRIQGALLGHFGSVFPAMMTTDQVRQI